MRYLIGRYNAFNDWLSEILANMLSAMEFFYFCVALDLVELPPVIAMHNVIVWCTYISQTVIQLIALPILGSQQKHHKAHGKKLDRIEKSLAELHKKI